MSAAVVVVDEAMKAGDGMEEEVVRHHLGEADGGSFRGKGAPKKTSWDTSANFYYPMMMDDDRSDSDWNYPRCSVGAEHR